MSIGCCIYFTPQDRSWIATADFVRGLASTFGATTFKRVWIYRWIPDPHDDLRDDQEELYKIENVPIEQAAAAMRADDDCFTHMYFKDDDTALLMSMGAAIQTTLPREVLQGVVPSEASFIHGRWEVYDYGGDFVAKGMCCVELSNTLGYPVGMQKYLAAYLAVPEVVQFQQRLEELSGQPWEALMELT